MKSKLIALYKELHGELKTCEFFLRIEKERYVFESKRAIGLQAEINLIKNFMDRLKVLLDGKIEF
jgi:hypothetical protein